MKPYQVFLFILSVLILTFITTGSYKSENPIYFSVAKTVDDSIYHQYELWMKNRNEKQIVKNLKEDSLYYTNIEKLLSDTSYASFHKHMEKYEKKSFISYMVDPVIKIIERIDTIRDKPDSIVYK